MTSDATSPEFCDQFSAQDFRRALGNFATGVTIITARSAEGDLVGTTASSFNSLSLDPPLILWSCIKESRACPIYESADYFAVNVLASDQMELSNHFARQQLDKFAGIDWEEGIGGVPVFPNCAARFQCETHDKFDGGDHWIFVGKVIAFDDFGRSPLCFHQGSYATLFSHPGASSKTDSDTTNSDSNGRLANHKFFLMLKAVRAYQDAYQPKLKSLELNLIESRVLLFVHDYPGIDAGALSSHVNAPINEVTEAQANLGNRGFVVVDGNGCNLTDKGQAKANECWELAAAHAKQAFANFSDEQIDNFSDVLNALIAQ